MKDLKIEFIVIIVLLLAILILGNVCISWGNEIIELESTVEKFEEVSTTTKIDKAIVVAKNEESIIVECYGPNRFEPTRLLLFGLPNIDDLTVNEIVYVIYKNNEYQIIEVR